MVVVMAKPTVNSILGICMVVVMAKPTVNII